MTTANRRQTLKWTEIADRLDEYRPRRLQRYRGINALLLYWENADIPSEQDAKDLGQMFCEHVNYRTHNYEIPSSDQAGPSLALFLSRFLKECGGSDNLILVHYGGHGESSDELSNCIWAR